MTVGRWRVRYVKVLKTFESAWSSLQMHHTDMMSLPLHRVKYASAVLSEICVEKKTWKATRGRRRCRVLSTTHRKLKEIYHPWHRHDFLCCDSSINLMEPFKSCHIHRWLHASCMDSLVCPLLETSSSTSPWTSMWKRLKSKYFFLHMQLNYRHTNTFIG